MPATVTLPTTTLAEGCCSSQTIIKLTSTASLTPGLYMYIDGELMRFTRLTVDPWVEVRRGADGTAGREHSAGVTVYIGRADQFYSQPPVGRPSASIPVSPYIDSTAGRVYWAQGDTSPSASALRWWQEEQTTRTSGPLGVVTATPSPTSST